MNRTSHYRYRSALLVAAVLLGALAATQSGARTLRDPSLRSTGVLVVDASDSSVLVSKHADVASPIASITKLMTSLVVLEANQPMDELITISQADVDVGRGAVSRLSVGATLTRADLMHLALMSSENRAAHALGNNYPGGMTAMVAAMNAKAQSLGMTGAHFVEPTGLSSQNVASPVDLSKLVVAASRNPTIRAYSTDTNYTVRVRRHMVNFRNTDRLVSSPAWDIVVQKTGYITEAGRCLVMEAIIDGRSVVIVLLDSFGKYTRLADATRIKHWMEVALHRSDAPAQVSMR
jgi:D-alanyl-D-alanine endopeptidase (penicillin-binding protein 7)